MVERLAHGTASVSELAQPLSMSLAAVVQPLGVLEYGRDRGLREDRPGQGLPARAAGPHPQSAGSPRNARQWEQRLDRLGELLAQPDDDHSS